MIRTVVSVSLAIVFGLSGAVEATTLNVGSPACTTYDVAGEVEHRPSSDVNLTPSIEPPAQVALEEPVGEPGEGRFIRFSYDVEAEVLTGPQGAELALSRDPEGACAALEAEGLSDPEQESPTE